MMQQEQEQVAEEVLDKSQEKSQEEPVQDINKTEDAHTDDEEFIQLKEQLGSEKAAKIMKKQLEALRANMDAQLKSRQADLDSKISAVKK